MNNLLTIEYCTFGNNDYENHQVNIEVSRSIFDITLTIEYDSQYPAKFEYYQYENGKIVRKQFFNVFNHYDILQYLIKNNISYKLVCNNNTLSLVNIMYDSIMDK